MPMSPRLSGSRALNGGLSSGGTESGPDFGLGGLPPC